MAEDYAPGPPPKEALDFFRSKGYTVGFDYRDVWKQEHAAAFTVAKAMSLDILQDIRGGLDAALAEGKTFQQFQKELRPLLEQKGWWGVKDTVDPKTGEKKKALLGSPRRLKTIYDANLRSALSAGQWDKAQRTKSVLPFFEYRLGPSENHRHSHEAIAGTILPVDDPFWDMYFTPNGYGCKCWLKQITKREADRKGGQSAAPKVEMKEWLNKRTGKVELVPKGIDPGWDVNPGKDRMESLLKSLGNKVEQAPAGIASGIVKSTVQSASFQQWMDKPAGNHPVGVLDKALQEQIKAKQKTVLFSPESINKQKEKHPELTFADYSLLPEMFAKGEVITQGDLKLIFFMKQGKLYKAVVKATADGAENYLVTFFITDSKEMERALKNGKKIR
jgi:hypothetical protein